MRLGRPRQRLRSRHPVSQSKGCAEVKSLSMMTPLGSRLQDAGKSSTPVGRWWMSWLADQMMDVSSAGNSGT
ncbi:Uncharacterized protein HZ326_22981 [Fusarium oxysporum f. sp. albedinis]|nr:Uncharacterized protein HZ326_22981 [Fusarium oxysporum f. sp. albedinis]